MGMRERNVKRARTVWMRGHHCLPCWHWPQQHQVLPCCPQMSAAPLLFPPFLRQDPHSPSLCLSAAIIFLLPQRSLEQVTCCPCRGLCSQVRSSPERVCEGHAMSVQHSTGLTLVYFETAMMKLIMTGQPSLSNGVTELNSLQLHHQF